MRASARACARACHASVRHACVCCKRCRRREAGPEVLTVLKEDLRERAGGTVATTSDPPEQQHEQMARCRRRAPWNTHPRRCAALPAFLTQNNADDDLYMPLTTHSLSKNEKPRKDKDKI